MKIVYSLKKWFNSKTLHNASDYGDAIITVAADGCATPIILLSSDRDMEDDWECGTLHDLEFDVQPGLYFAKGKVIIDDEIDFTYIDWTIYKPIVTIVS